MGARAQCAYAWQFMCVRECVRVLSACLHARVCVCAHGFVFVIARASG